MKKGKVQETDLWSVPLMWEGQTACILASGPSMSQAVADTVKPTLWRTIAINNTFRLAPWADMLYAADARWWNHNLNTDSKTFSGLRVGIKHYNDSNPKDVLLLKNTGQNGFDENPTCLRTGANSGYQALHIAVHAGCKRVILCGFDMRSVNRRQHWHDPHAHPMRDHSDGIYPGWIASFKTLVPILEKKGVEVFNATPNSALRCFKMAELSELVAVTLKEREAAVSNVARSMPVEDSVGLSP